MNTTRIAPRTWNEHPDLDVLAEMPAVRIKATQLRSGMVLLDSDLKTPVASLDKKVRSTRGSGNVEFLAFDYDRSTYAPIAVHANATVWVAA
jgi:hypothetical protein